MDILTTEIREILARLRDLEFISTSVYSVMDEEYIHVVNNIVELRKMLQSTVSQQITKQLKYEAEMEKLGKQIDMLED